MTAASLSQWPRLSLLLDELLDLDPPALAQRLATLREQDPELAEAAEGLLGHLTSIDRDGFLQAPPRLPGEALTGQAVGAYQIEREIGQGGMGTVWLARRTDGRFEGQVAIKFLAAGFASRGGAARFTREGHVLARLAHPHIARLLDAGVAAGGQPYLVLDYVDGQPIDRYCDAAGLDATARVRLCLDVLDAVAHAHTRLILHRDIKPSNILVTAAGDVKLLDFGIAKLLDDQTGAGQATELTRESGSAFTMGYAAPEQVQGGDVTTATDVFALGVLLHVLLIGLHPSGTADTPMERMRQLVEVVPPPMSQALAQAGKADTLKRARALRGDLDTIVAKALKKLPAERYANAEQLADDLRRWLNDVPILARRDARLYRLRKFIKRYRTGVAVGTLAFAGLAIGIAVALWQAAEARGQHEQAEGLIEFMLGDLRTKLQPVGRLDVLDAVGAKALAYYAAQDEARLDANSLGRHARALHLLGEIAESRGKLVDALSRFTQAQSSTAALLVREPRDEQRIFDHSQSVYWVGLIAWRQGKLSDAEAQFKRYEALAEQLVALNPSKPDWQLELASAHQNLGTVMLHGGRVLQARDALLKAQALFKPLVAANSDLTQELGNNLSWVARTEERLGRIGAAIAELQARTALLKALPAAKRDRHLQRDLGATANEISRLELLRGRPADALGSAEQALTTLLPLVRLEPNNTLWQRDVVGAEVRTAEAGHALDSASLAARSSADRALALTRQLLSRDSSDQILKVNLLGLATLLQARTSPMNQREVAINNLADWLASVPQGADASSRPMVCQAALLIAEHHSHRAQPALARQYWTQAAAQVKTSETAPDLITTACALRARTQLGLNEEARQLAQHLLTTEFKHPDYLADVEAAANRP